jgi:hypothetical protein
MYILSTSYAKEMLRHSSVTARRRPPAAGRPPNGVDFSTTQ